MLVKIVCVSIPCKFMINDGTKVLIFVNNSNFFIDDNSDTTLTYFFDIHNPWFPSDIYDVSET